jgi:hypothetical protein
MSELKRVELEDGRKVEVAPIEADGEAVTLEGEGATIVGEIATAENVLVVEKPDGKLEAVKDEDLSESEPERAGPQL